jgi:hypothetical protein
MANALTIVEDSVCCRDSSSHDPDDRKRRIFTSTGLQHHTQVSSELVRCVDNTAFSFQVQVRG